MGRKGRHAKPYRRYLIDVETAAWVVRIFHWFLIDKRSLRWIARELNRRGAPKDHRATTKHWHHQQVSRLLETRNMSASGPGERIEMSAIPSPARFAKKIARQRNTKSGHGISRNFVLSPMSGWTSPQSASQKTKRRWQTVAGQTADWPAPAAVTAPPTPGTCFRACCAVKRCGAVFHVGGANGKYLFCPNYAKGVCTCQTQVQRGLAEKMILEAIGQRVLAKPAWRDAVLEETKQAWTELQRRQPGEIDTTDKALADIERRIERPT